eukprot:TRINITY_DN1364_c0_g1_i1.p1 TRINITY_DN1364_c0_g1~~TRINITY_DN1364_c0_g1_i1.p1  ORF type:complete len:232 (-),score=42.62 TRINITY_DN1364_c0_g1_i1:76-771(-)
MTFYHFVNCAALTFGPLFVFYKTRLSEYSVMYNCLRAGGAFLITQLFKMILFATFVPLANDESFVGFDASQEFMTAFVNMSDIVGLFLILGFVAGGADIRILSVAWGWATADAITSRLTPLWIGARSTEFDWINIQSALDANIDFLIIVAVVRLVWVLRLHFRNQKATVSPLTLVISSLSLVSFVLLPGIVSFARHVIGWNTWEILLLRLVYGVLVFAVSQQVHTRNKVNE